MQKLHGLKVLKSYGVCSLITGNTCSYDGEGEVELGVLVDLYKTTKGRDTTAKTVGHLPSSGPEVCPTSKPEINSNTPPSENMELFLKNNTGSHFEAISKS